jgi:NAD-dependent dihydropyrimidine dehydrogenase PreA subunit
VIKRSKEDRAKATVYRMRHRTKNLISFHRYKEENGCFDCGAMLPHYVLEFDHKPEFEKINSPYRVMKDLGLKKAWEEIAKCDVVCANCHRIRTYERKPWGENSSNPEYN